MTKDPSSKTCQKTKTNLEPESITTNLSKVTINFLTLFIATATDPEEIMSPNYGNETEGSIRALRSTQAYKDVTKSSTGN